MWKFDRWCQNLILSLLPLIPQQKINVCWRIFQSLHYYKGSNLMNKRISETFFWFFSGNLQVYRNWYLDSNNAFLVSVDSNSPPSGEFALYKYVRFKIVLNNLLSNCAKILSVVSLKMLSCQRSKYCIDTSKKERLLQNLPLWQRDELVEANVCRKSCCSKILSCTPSRLVWQIYSRRPAIKLNCKRKRLEIWLFSFFAEFKIRSAVFAKSN